MRNMGAQLLLQALIHIKIAVCHQCHFIVTAFVYTVAHGYVRAPVWLCSFTNSEASRWIEAFTLTDAPYATAD